jgi:uncharacterized repeat protein (TIGR02543 family)
MLSAVAPAQNGKSNADPRGGPTVVITPATTPTATDNDYTRINNAIQSAVAGETIKLLGTFNWTETNAAASWALGSDGVAGTLDDYSILVPGNLNNVTFTADNLGDATIQGPGDLPQVDLEGVFFFNGGGNQNWTISNIRFLDFDLTIGMFSGTGGTTAYNNTHIVNNYIRMARDVDSPNDPSQNIGIYYSFGTNQLISGNTIDIQGDGLTTSGNFAADIGMQCDTSGGNVYDGLHITNNTIRVLNAQSANPEVIIGIWENAHGHSSNITISGNSFTNLAAGNNPATNLQRGFRITSHSSGTTTVTYSNNTVSGANIGFQWLAGQAFAGNQPVLLTSNTITGNSTGVLVQSQGLANLSFNRIVGNTVTGLNNVDGTVTAENNWWGCNAGPGTAGCDAVSGTVDFNPWIVLGVSASPNPINPGAMSTVTADMTHNSDNLVPSGTMFVPQVGVAFAATQGTIAPPTGTITNGQAMSTFTSTSNSDGSASATVDNQTVTTVIAMTTYTLTYTAGPNGSISGTSPQTVVFGGSGTPVTAVPNTGYHFVNWSDASTSNPRTDTNVMMDISVTANFAINTYTLTYTAGPNGSISGTSPQMVNYGADGTPVTAVPNTGYHFVNWSDSSTQNPRTDTNVMADISVTANFAINTYTVTYDGNTNTGGTAPVDPNSPYNYNSTVTVLGAGTLTKTGYTFTGWNTAADGSGTSYSPGATFNITVNVTLYAQWTVRPPATTVYVDDDWTGLPNGVDPDGGGPATEIGYDAFATIQGGVNGVANPGTVIVYAGNYPEAVTVNKSLTINGAKAGQDANTRFAAFVSGPNGPKANPAVESILTAAATAPHSGANDTLHVMASNVIFNGFVVDGNNPNLDQSGAVVIGGINTDSRTGIQTEDAAGNNFAANNVLIEYNIVQNFAGDNTNNLGGGITLVNPTDTSPPTSGSLITRNLVRNFGAYGIELSNNAYGDVTFNSVDTPEYPTANAGIWVYDFPNSGVGPKTINITDNNVTVGQDNFGGIWINLVYASAATININTNTVNAAAGVLPLDDFTYGIYLSSVQGGSTAHLNANTVGGAGGTFDRGIALWNLPTTTRTTVTDSTVGNSVKGVSLHYNDPNFGPGANSAVDMSGVTIFGTMVGVFVDAVNSGSNMITMTVTNSTLSGNTAANGGGITSSGTGGVASTTITNSTLSGNSPSGASILLQDASLTIGNTIFNTRASGTNISALGTSVVSSRGYNLSSDNFGGFLTATGDQVNTDPMLGPLKDNGGPTLTHAPLEGSPAIDQGKDIGPIGPAYTATGEDQRGSMRPVNDPAIPNAVGGDGSDIGAVELAVGVHASSAASRKTHGAAGDFDISLPLTGPVVGIECRGTGAATNLYKMVLIFENPVTFSGAAVTSGTGTVDSVMTNSVIVAGVSGTQVTINLSGVTDVQTLTVGLFDVDDGVNMGDVGVRMHVLIGDATGNGAVNSSDITFIKAKLGAVVNGTTFRADITANGDINSSDVALTKSKIP